MNLETILISAIVGIITSLITAYITTRLKMREEREKWQREFSIKYLETQTTDSALAHKMAIQFAIGFLKYRNDETKPQKIFIPPNYRLTVGRGQNNDICISDRMLSRIHCAFYSDDTNVFIEHLGSTITTLLNGERVNRRTKLKAEDVIEVGKTEFRFYQMEKR